MADDKGDFLDVRKEVTYMGNNPAETSTDSQPVDPNALQGVFHDPEGSDWDEPTKLEYPQHSDAFRVSDPTNPEYDPTNPNYRPELDERNPYLRDVQYMERDQDGSSDQSTSPDQSSGAQSDDTPAPSPVHLSGSLEMDMYRDPQAGGDSSDEDDSTAARGQQTGSVSLVGSGEGSGDSGSGAESENNSKDDGVLLKGGIEQDEYRQAPQDLGGELDPMPPQDLDGELDPLPSPQLVAETPIWDPVGGLPPDDLPEGAYVMGSSSATTDVHAELWQGGDEHPWSDILGAGTDEFSAPAGLPVAPSTSDSPEDLQSWSNDTGAAINQALQETIQSTDENPSVGDPNAQGSDDFSRPADPAEYVSNPESPGYDPTSSLYNPSYDWSRSDGNAPGGSGDGTAGGDDGGSQGSQYQQYQTIAAETDPVENDNADTLAILTPMVANTYMYTIDDSALNPAPSSDGAPSYEPSAPPQTPADNGQPSDPSGAPSDPSNDPSGDPSNDPSGDPSGDPSYDPSSDQPDGGDPAPSIPDPPPPPPEVPSDPSDSGGDGGGDLGSTGGEGLGAMAGFSSEETWTHFGTMDPAFDPSHDAAHGPLMASFDQEHGLF